MLDFLFRRRTGHEPVKVIAGLGNPGPGYESTRHNVGWWVVDHLADVWHFDGWRKNGESLVATGILDSVRVHLIKPLTYMNRSGSALRPYLRREGWRPATDLLVVVDEVALPLGKLRLRARGSAGGHNGLKSIEQAIGHQEYARLRIGIKPLKERRTIGDLSDFVLEPFGRAERAVVLDALPRCVTTAEQWLRHGIVAAMNVCNADSPQQPGSSSTLEP